MSQIRTTAPAFTGVVIDAEWTPCNEPATPRRRSRSRAAQRRKAERDRRRVLAMTLAVITVVLYNVVTTIAGIGGTIPQGHPSTPPAVTAVGDDESQTQEAPKAEEQTEAEKIDQALLAQGYYSTAVPMCNEHQDYMRTYSRQYGCPYPLALAVAEVESTFNAEAIGAAGEVGYMQLNPGPGGSYHDELEAATGQDPKTVSGNIAGGCYLLGKYLAEYDGDTTKALMAYNMGRGGAQTAWAAGTTSTKYTREVTAAQESWECTVNAWEGY